MEELKTLKDFDMGQESLTGEICVVLDELRQEAVKWIKEDIDKDTTEKNKKELFGVRAWIKHFFNLTEEDLKNG